MIFFVVQVLIIGVTGEKRGKNGFFKRLFDFTRLYLNNKKNSTQIAFISDHSLEQHSKDIIKNVAVTEIKW